MTTVSIKNFATLTRLPGSVESELKALLTFPNPAWQEKQRRGHWNGNTPKEILGFKKEGGGLLIPRGFTEQALELLKQSGVVYRKKDKRRTLPEIDFSFSKNLRDYQEEAVKAVLDRDFGTLKAPTGSGKTVIALAVIAARRQPALIVVHTKELLNQWVDQIGAFLGIPADQVGIIGGGKKRIGEAVTVALVKSLSKCAKEIAPHIGFLVVDECHRAVTTTYKEAITAFDCRYMLGLSATPWRRDGLPS